MTLTDVRIGNQRPRLEHLPVDIASHEAGDEVIEFAESYGLILDDWQRHVVRHMCAEREDGSWSATQSVLLVPRQAGKSALLEAVEMAALFLWGYEHVIYSAHLQKTSTDHMRRLRRHVNHPSLKGQARVLTGKGDERVELVETGAILEFITRGKKSSRGGSPGLVIFDEALFLQDDQIQAMLPALSAQSMNEDAAAQMIYTSSAPIAESTVLHRLRRRALEKAPPRMYFAEWSVTADADPADRDNWYEANPGLGIRISEEWIADNEYGTLSDEAFLTERLGVPVDPHVGTGPINVDRWNELIDADAMPTPESVRLAIDCPPDRTSASFAVAGKLPNGLLFAERRDHLHPERMGQLVARAKELTDGHNTPLIVPPGSPALAWKSELLAAGVPLDEMTPAEYAAACGYISAAIAEGKFRHTGQPELTNAAAGLSTRTTGDVEVWARRTSSVNIAPFVAATCALARVPEEAKIAYAGPLVAVR